MKNQKDSVAKGGSSVALARIVGMAFSFLLFLLLARHSANDAAVFRTVMTYILISESIGMLGMQRWLANEIAPDNMNRWRLFMSANAFTLGFTIILSVIYVAIAQVGIYTTEFNQGLYLGALAVIPSGIYMCLQACMIGIGRNQLMGRMNMFENLTRCTIAIALILFDQPVMSIIWVFVITRWAASIYGFIQLKQLFTADKTIISWKSDHQVVAKMIKEMPKFAFIVAAFVLLRNAGLVILPAYSNAIETATYAVGYQLFDLILVIPSVLAVTSTHVFANKAIASQAALKKASIQLISISSLALFPLIAITAGFAQQFIHMLYGDKYSHGQISLVILMMASGLAMIDQVLSQIMLAKKDYRQDMVAIVVGAIVVLIFTLILSKNLGAQGAAIALALGLAITILARMVQLKKTFGSKLLFISTWKQIFASFMVYGLIYFCGTMPALAMLYQSNYLWILGVPVAFGLYVFMIYFLGCLKRSQLYRMRQFLFHH